MNKAVAREFEIFCGSDIKRDDWLWCRKCHRCYKASEFRYQMIEGDIFLGCHYKNCRGDLPLDSRQWSRVIKGKAGFPEIPEKGKVYDV